MHFPPSISVDVDFADADLSGVGTAFRMTTYSVIATLFLILAIVGCLEKMEQAGGVDRGGAAVTWAGETKIASLNADEKIGFVGEPPAAAYSLMICAAVTNRILGN